MQTALHCLTPAKLRYRRSELNTNGFLDFEQAPIRLRRRIQATKRCLDPVYFLIAYRYRLIRDSDDAVPGKYQILPIGYEYMIGNHQQREILVFHWHPGQRSHEHDPHVHIGSAIIDAGSSDIGKTFSRFHIPTGHISITQVVRLLLTDFNVVPNRQDWEAVLAGALSVDT